MLAVCVVFTAFGCSDTQYSVTLNFDADGGEVRPADENISLSSLNKDSEIVLVITPKEGYTLASVTIDDGDATDRLATSDDGNSYCLTVRIDKNIAVSVSFLRESAEIVIPDSDRYTITLSAPENGSYYTDGETVTATVVDKSGYKVTGLKIGSTEYPVKSGTVQFPYSAGISVEPICLELISEDLLNKLQQNVRFYGTYVYDVSNHPDWTKSFYVETIFADNKISTTEIDMETGDIYYDLVYGKNKRNLTQYVRTENNTVEEYISTSLFDEFYNPFLLLTTSDLYRLSDGRYSLTDMSKSSKVASPITGYNENMAEFFISVNSDGQPVKLSLKTEQITRQDAIYTSSYDFDILDLGTATVPVEKYTPYPSLPEHSDLTAALTAAKEASSYTIRHQGHELNVADEDKDNPLYQDTDYNIYVVRGDLIFDNYPNQRNGYKSSGGYVYPFYVTTVEGTDKITFEDPINVSSIEAITSDPLGFCPELLKYVDEKDGIKTFVVHSGNYAPLIAPYFGEGVDEQAYYAYATEFSLTLKNDVLYQIKFQYTTYGISEEVTLTYDFGTDISDIVNSLDFENASKTSVLDAFIGQYRDSSGNFCQCDNSGFILNGIEVTELSYYSATATGTTDLFVGKWKDATISISKLSQKQLLIQSDDFEINYTLTNILTEKFVIPEEYRGVWSIDNEDEGLHLEFVIQTYVMWCNGSEMTLLSSSDREGLVVIVGTTTYNIIPAVDDAQQKFLYVIELKNNAEYTSFSMDYISGDVGIEIPEKFVGVYLSDDGKQKVTVTYTKITVNGVVYQPTSYSDENGFVGVLGDTEGYMIMFQRDETSLLIGTRAENYTVKPVDSPSDSYIGIWESVVNGSDDYESYSYRFVITDTEMRLTASYYIKTQDESGKTVYTLFEYDDEALTYYLSDYGYAFHLKGSEYETYLLNYTNSFGNSVMMLYDDNELAVNLSKVNESVIPQEYVGTWRATNDGKDYEVILQKNGTVNIDPGLGYSITDIKGKYDKNKSELTFTINDKLYYLLLRSDNNGCYINLYCIAENIDIDLSQVAEIHLQEKFHGTWKNSDGSYEFVIKAEEFKLIMPGMTDYAYVLYLGVSEDDLGNKTYFSFFYDGTKYELEAGNYGDDMMILTFYDDEEELHYVPLTRVVESTDAEEA